MAQTHDIGDFVEHRRTYDLFIRIATMGSLHIASVLIAIVVGTIENAPWIAAIGVLAATAAAGYGMVRPGRGNPWPAAVVALALFVLMGTLA